jgi:hypothetical protein
VVGSSALKYVKVWFEFSNSYIIIIGIVIEFVYTDVVECVQRLKMVNFSKYRRTPH